MNETPRGTVRLRYALGAVVVVWIGASVFLAPEPADGQRVAAGEDDGWRARVASFFGGGKAEPTPVPPVSVAESGADPLPAPVPDNPPPVRRALPPGHPPQPGFHGVGHGGGHGGHGGHGAPTGHGGPHGMPAVEGDFEEPYPLPPEIASLNLVQQSEQEAAIKSQGCVVCHEDQHDPHGKESLNLGCTDCHGGDATTTNKHIAHVQPRLRAAWPTSANPQRSYTLLNHEDPMFIRFVNPGDLRVAHMSCGLSGCHQTETLQVRKSMMTHGCMLWGAALYNNGAVPHKWSRYGESYSMNGKPQRLVTVPTPTPEETATKGVLPYLDPLPRFQVTHPGNVLRIFERGGRFIFDTASPERLEEPGRPRNRLSNRGLGTLNRTDPVFIGLQKTRLLDPTLNFLGTNDHAGDYRSSGCTACHVVYANDRSPVNSGPYAGYGNRGRRAPAPDSIYTGPEERVFDIVKSVDPTIPANEEGHPIHHKFTTGVPTSQCIVCHVHPGTTVMNSYTGYIWWDQETDGKFMYGPKQKDNTAEEFTRSEMFNPNQVAAKGLWNDPEFLANVTDLNPHLQKTQFADYHGHGWVFRAVFNKDDEGNVLDNRGEKIKLTNRGMRAAIDYPNHLKEVYRDRESWDEEEMFRVLLQEESLREKYEHVPVHLLDIHLAKGMHCVDCHFVQDVHGDTKLYGEVRAAIEIKCVDCHGDTDHRAHRLAGPADAARASMRTSGPAAKEHPSGLPEKTGRDLLAMRTPFGKRRFEVRGDRLVQNSLVEPGVSWEVPQVRDTLDPKNPRFNARSALAKTVRFEAGDYAWGDVPADKSLCAHDSSRMSCISCHSSWNPSCYGCHLPQKADRKFPDLHNEGDITKNYVAYNFQTLRDEVFMLGHDGNVTKNRIGPTRSSCAIHVGSYNANRESIYVQQQTVSAEGLSGIAFSSNVPHTVGAKETTRNCTSCHLSADNDNNAKLAQLMMHGTGYLNFIGRWAWVASGEHGLFGVEVTERSEPQSVIGSSMHELAYPEYYEEHLERHRHLEHAHEHPGNDIGANLFRPFQKHEVVDVQLRGEFLYAACGEAGVRLYDVAFIDNKAFSERITSAPVSPLGQRFFLRTKDARCVCAPTTIVPDPTRTHKPENCEPKVHPLYAYLFIADREEGLITTSLGTALDGNPTNRFLEREVTFNPGGCLHGAEHVSIVGTYAYVLCDKGLVVVDFSSPKSPRITSIIGKEFICKPKSMQTQFRYGFVVDEQGLKVLDTTDIAHPRFVRAMPLPGKANSVYVGRTYAYVACLEHGLVIVNVKNPEEPFIDQVYDAHGKMNDVHDVQLGITYNSQFAYVADGHHGMRVLQLTSPDTHGNNGFSPRPEPKLIATFEYPHGGEALAISRGVDRDRAVDESGNQLAVFGRVGAGPLSLLEQQRLYIDPGGELYHVIDGKRNYDQYRITPQMIEAWADGRLTPSDVHRSTLLAREYHLARQFEDYYGRARPFRTPYAGGRPPSAPPVEPEPEPGPRPGDLPVPPAPALQPIRVGE